ncbi:MAG TPA: Hsp20/alpha crystallin family protein [Gaiellaceae bacterium]|nr:Hsp20/alpha crystallin family protein [Gaiellaceae bacterium]
MDDVEETGDMIVLTLDVPRDGLAISVRDRTVTVEADGFRRELVLSGEADVAHLHAQLYDRTLELRAPRIPAVARPIPLRVLR